MDQDYITLYENGQYQSEVHISEFSRAEAFPKIEQVDEAGRPTGNYVEVQVKTIRALFLSKEFDMVDDTSKAYFIRVEYYDNDDNRIRSVFLGPSNPNKEEKQQSSSK